MSTTVERRPRKHARSDDSPIPNRQASSIEMVLDHARAAVRAWQDGDEAEIRSGLRELASEAERLASMPELPLPGLLRSRQRIAVERDRSGRGGSA